jgi:hypothetical protein
MAVIVIEVAVMNVVAASTHVVCEWGLVLGASEEDTAVDTEEAVARRSIVSNFNIVFLSKVGTWGGGYRGT